MDRTFIAATVLLVIFASAPTMAQWTEWRGSPDHYSVVTAPAPREGALRWRFDTGNQVLSSPVFCDRGAIIGSDDGWLYCIDTTEGTLSWKFRTGAEIQSTPLIEGDRAYFGSFDGLFYCIDLPEGSGQPRKVWSYDCGSQIISSAHRYGDGLVFGCNDGAVYMVLDNGSLAWRTPVGNEIWATPLVDNRSGHIFVGDVVGRFVKIDAGTGEVLRSVQLMPERSEVYSSAVLHDGTVYITTGEGRRLLGLSAEDLSVVFSFDSGHATYSTPSIADGRIFFGSFEYVWCVPLDDPDGNVTEEEVVWSFPTHDFQGGSSPVILSDSLAIGSDDYNLYVLDLATGELRFNFTARGYIYSSPAYHDGALYFGSSDWSVYCVGEPSANSLRVQVTTDPPETTSDATVLLDVLVLDPKGVPVPGASVSVLGNAGDAVFEGDPVTGADGKVTAVFSPFPVSSRSTIELTVQGVEGDRTGRSVLTLIIEPGEEVPEERGGIVSPQRPLYVLGIAVAAIIDMGLLTFYIILKRRLREGTT